MKVKIRVACDV